MILQVGNLAKKDAYGRVNVRKDCFLCPWCLLVNENEQELLMHRASSTGECVFFQYDN